MEPQMKLAIETLAYKEERLILKFIQHYQDKVDEILVLNTSKPWKGKSDELDNTASIARSLGVSVIEHDWSDETAQRNAGLAYLHDFDWVIVLDPDEFLSNTDWAALVQTLERAEAPAYVVQHQRVFYKDKEVFPHSDYQQIIAINPKEAQFVDKRVVNCVYGVAPVDLFHMSWARTDEEVLRKITHYSHADELIPDWYEEVWLTDRKQNLHPKDPEVLAALIGAELPPELEALDLFP